MARWLLALLLVVTALLLERGQAAQAVDCQFLNDFKRMADAMPEVVGDCAGNEYDGQDGTWRQISMNGYFVWRAADNYTTFTAGNRTWALTSRGVVEVTAPAFTNAPQPDPRAAQAQAACRPVAVAIVNAIIPYLRQGTTIAQATQPFASGCEAAALRAGNLGAACYYYAHMTAALRIPYYSDPTRAFNADAAQMLNGCVAGGVMPPPVTAPPAQRRPTMCIGDGGISVFCF